MKRLSLILHQVRQIRSFCFLFFLCSLLALSCGKQSITLGPIIVGTTLGIHTIDPSDAYKLLELNILNNVGDTLYAYKQGTVLVQPHLASDMPKISQDGLTYIIPLRTDVFFHDGTAFDAESMAFSLNRFVANKGVPSFLLSDKIESVEATDKYELTIKLKAPFAPLPLLLAFSGTCAVSPKAYKMHEFRSDQFVGTGPYKVTKLNSDNLQLEAFDKYWGVQPLSKRINIQIFTSSANLLNGFRTNNVDVIYRELDFDQIEYLKQEASEKHWQVIKGAGIGTTSYWGLNLKHSPLDEPVVRQALASVLNRSLIIERVLRGQAEPIYSLVSPVFDVYKPVFKEHYGDVNTKKAKLLLKEAGYSSENPLKLELWYPSSSSIRRDVAHTLRDWVDQELEGILKLEVHSIGSEVYLDNIGKGVYSTFLLDWSPDFLDPDNYVQPFLECLESSVEGRCNQGGSKTFGSFYYNEKVNQLIKSEQKEQDSQSRKAVFTEIQDISATHIPYIPLWESKNYVFANDNLLGVNLDLTNVLSLWTIKKEN